ncbi:MAG TPA: FAD-dependent oxidoreductase [Saprospiraceae bacterium]|nr:FAD-dependent oxidoreductase [Saprospiraceae bacterium]
MVQDFSIWEHDAYHRTWDICIIGAGINGISTGISILEKKPDSQILIIDRWFIPLGASTRNAGFACFGSPSEILDDILNIGEEQAVALVEKRWLGLQKLKSRLENSKANFEISGGYELYHEDEFERINSKLDYLNSLMQRAIGHANIFSSKDVPSGIRGFSKAIYNPHEGQLHPAFMMQHLKEVYLKLGGNLWTGLKIDAIEEQPDGVLLRSRLALPVEAKKVIVATNGFTSDLLPDIDIYGARNHVFVTEPIPGLQLKGCFHFDKGFYYFRNIGDRILIGGARNKDQLNENTEQFGTNQIIVDELEKFLYTHLAEKSTRIDYRWSGIIAVGKEKLPIIKSITPRLFAGVRCSGMGIALASLTGEELADMVLQQDQ